MHADCCGVIRENTLLEISNTSKYVTSDFAGSECGLMCRGVGKYKVSVFMKM